MGRPVQLLIGVSVVLALALMAGTGGWMLLGQTRPPPHGPSQLVMAQPDLVGAELVALRGRLNDAERVIEGLKGARPAFFSNDPPTRPDDLCVIRGVDAMAQSMLYNLGVHTYGQLARLTREDVDYVAARMELSPQRIEEQLWVQQAMTLAALHGQPLG